jgi:hypothetical protein
LHRFEESGAKLGAKSRDEFIVEWSLKNYGRFGSGRSGRLGRNSGSGRLGRNSGSARASRFGRGSRHRGCAACGLVARGDLRRFRFLGLVSHGPGVQSTAMNRLLFTDYNKRAAENSNAAFLTHAAKLVNHKNL